MIQTTVRLIFFCLAILTLISCQQDQQSAPVQDRIAPVKENNVRDNSANQSTVGISVDQLKFDLIKFLEHFKTNSYKTNRLDWDYSTNSYSVTETSSGLLDALLYTQNNNLQYVSLAPSFNKIFYYIDEVQRDYKYNRMPIPVAVEVLLSDYLKNKFKIDSKDETQAILTLRTYSSLLRLINEMNDARQLPKKLIGKFGDMPFPKIKEVLTRDLYDSVRTEFHKINKVDENSYNPAHECQKYWAISPILTIDPLLSTDLERLNKLAKEVHGLFDDKEKNMYGELKDHLLCIETIEESIGRSPDPSTGEGITNKYLAFIMKALWDYPFRRTQCAPFMGVMALIPRSSGEPIDYCKDNYKTVVDNLYLLYLLKRYNVTGNINLNIGDVPQRYMSQSIILEHERKLEKEMGELAPSKE